MSQMALIDQLIMLERYAHGNLPFWLNPNNCGSGKSVYLSANLFYMGVYSVYCAVDIPLYHYIDCQNQQNLTENTKEGTVGSLPDDQSR